jgi:hypothetical protein
MRGAATIRGGFRPESPPNSYVDGAGRRSPSNPASVSSNRRPSSTPAAPAISSRAAPRRSAPQRQYMFVPLPARIQPDAGIVRSRDQDADQALIALALVDGHGIRPGRDVPRAARTRSVAATRRDGPRTGDRQRPHAHTAIRSSSNRFSQLASWFQLAENAAQHLTQINSPH